MMGRRASAGLVGAAVCLVGVSALGAPQRRDTGPLFAPIDTGQGAAARARALSAGGHCDKALVEFDAALRSSIDMTVRRDRGLCHEALGNPYPAMDDYRAYLALNPDASDADDIRARLERLETQTGVGGPSVNGPRKSAEDVPDEPALGEDSTPGTVDNGKRTRIQLLRRNYDEEEDAYRKYDRAMASALRRGKGGIFGVYSGLRVVDNSGVFGPIVDVGARIGWAFDQVSTLYGRIGYAQWSDSFSDLAHSATSAGGFELGIGYEARIRLDDYATHNLLLGAIAEYHRVVFGATNTVVDAFLPTGRVGYRLVLGYGFAIEATGDFGAAISMDHSATVPFVFGGQLAFLVSF